MITVLIADDDPDDRMLAIEALRETGLGVRVETVGGGAELVDYLQGRPPYEDRHLGGSPRLVLLDLNMPGVDGVEALTRIRSDPALRHLPTIVFSTSDEPGDVLRCYRAGCNAYIRKPPTFDRLVTVVRDTVRYWLGTIELPPPTART